MGLEPQASQPTPQRKLDKSIAPPAPGELEIENLSRALFTLVLAAPIATPNQEGFSIPLEGLNQRDCLAGEYECFQLFNRYEPIRAVIGVTTNEIGLTEERVRTTIEGRLCENLADFT